MKTVGEFPRVLLVINVDWFFLSHFLALFKQIRAAGFEVYVMGSDTGDAALIEENGFKFINISVERKGAALWRDVRLMLRLRKLYKQYDPAIIEHVTLKLSILGTLASLGLRRSKVINYFSGMGYAFTLQPRHIVRKMAEYSIRVVGRIRKSTFVVENEDDRLLMTGLLRNQKAGVAKIKGVGIDLDVFCPVALPQDGTIRILFPARILVNKGIYEFIEAAGLCRGHKEMPANVRFLIAGKIDAESRYHIKEEVLQGMLVPGYVEWLGHSNNMNQLMGDADIIVLPSYREGLPKSLVEACAAGRPIIATNVPGCRECVRDGENGLLVPAGSAGALAEALLRLVNAPMLRQQMGARSRELAEQQFALPKIATKTVQLFQSILSE